MKIEDYSEETSTRLLYASKQILSKTELTSSNKIWFKPSTEKLSLEDYQLVINILNDLWILNILERNYFYPSPLNEFPIAYKLDVVGGALRIFIDQLENKLPSNSKNKIRTAYWPDYYKWDETGLKFCVGDGKKLTFRSKNKTWIVFSSMAKHKGEYVRVATMEKESGTKNVRVIISQIKDRIRNNGLSDYIKIEPLGKDAMGNMGSYRIIPT